MTLLDAKRFALFTAVWLILTAGDLSALAPGLVAAAGATWLAHHLARVGERPLRLLPLARLFPGFLWRSLLGGFDVARRVFLPRMPLSPGWFLHRTALPEGVARVALGSQISLMPGTLAAGCDGDDLLIHCLDTRDDVAAMIAGEERRLSAASDHG